MKPMCKCTWAFSSIKEIKLSPLAFSPFLGDNILVDLGRKHPLKFLFLYFSLLNFPSSLKSLQTNMP